MVKCFIETSVCYVPDKLLGCFVIRVGLIIEDIFLLFLLQYRKDDYSNLASNFLINN